MLLKRNCPLLCSYLITWVGIVFRPHDESVNGKYVVGEKKKSSDFFLGNVYPDFRYEKNMFICITELNKN